MKWRQPESAFDPTRPKRCRRQDLPSSPAYLFPGIYKFISSALFPQLNHTFIMASKTYNVGIVGYGFSAKIFHIPFVAEVPELKLYAIVQRTPKADDDAEKDHPGVKSFRTTEEMVQDPAIDIVIITTAPDSHFALSKLALEAGKHGTCLEVPESIYPANPMRVIVVCEKPFTPTTQEADELIAIAKKNNKQLAVFQSTSHQPNPNQLLESLD